MPKNDKKQTKPITPKEEIAQEAVQAGTILTLQQEYAQQAMTINNLRQTIGKQDYQIKRLEDSQAIMGADVQGTMNDVQLLVRTLKEKGLI